MKAYKVFKSDWTCRGFQFEVGKRYTYHGKISICVAGFHACEKLSDCFKYYPCVPWIKIAEVKLWGKIKYSRWDSKRVTDDIEIVKKINFFDIGKIIGNDSSDGVNKSYGISDSN
jgi:hypothetical protein